jgi:hypothetical protein
MGHVEILLSSEESDYRGRRAGSNGKGDKR